MFYIGSRKLYITALSRSHAHMPLSQGVTLCQYFCHSSSHNHGSSKVSLASRGAISTSMTMGGRLLSCFVCLGEGCHKFFPCRLTAYRWRLPQLIRGLPHHGFFTTYVRHGMILQAFDSTNLWGVKNLTKLLTFRILGGLSKLLTE